VAAVLIEQLGPLITGNSLGSLSLDENRARLPVVFIVYLGEVHRFRVCHDA
jgi:hypothetical protein